MIGLGLGLGLRLGLGLGFGVRVSRACADAEVVALELVVVAREVRALSFYKRHRRAVTTESEQTACCSLEPVAGQEFRTCTPTRSRVGKQTFVKTDAAGSRSDKHLSARSLN